MKLVIALLLGLVSASGIEQKVAQSLRKSTGASKLININLKRTEYKSEKSKMALTQVTNDIYQDLA
jgi:hypothetical protein